MHSAVYSLKNGRQDERSSRWMDQRANNKENDTLYMSTVQSSPISTWVHARTQTRGNVRRDQNDENDVESEGYR